MRDTHARSSRNSWLSRRIAQLHLARQLVEAQNAPTFTLTGIAIDGTSTQNGRAFYKRSGTINDRPLFEQAFTGTNYVAWSGTRWETIVGGMAKLYGIGDHETPDLCGEWFTVADVAGPTCTGYFQPPIPPEP